jgi:hypothetical protein
VISSVNINVSLNVRQLQCNNLKLIFGSRIYLKSISKMEREVKRLRIQYTANPLCDESLLLKRKLAKVACTRSASL